MAAVEDERSEKTPRKANIALKYTKKMALIPY